MKGLPPGPRGGVATSGAAWLLRPIPLLDHCARRYGDTFTVRVPPRDKFIFVTRPETIKRLFIEHRRTALAGVQNAVLAPLVGTRSVLTSDGPRHLRQRRLLLPAFHGEQLDIYREKIALLAEGMVGRWPVGHPFAVAAAGDA